MPNRAYVNLGTAVVSGVWSPTYRYSRAWRTLLAAQGEGYIYESVLRFRVAVSRQLVCRPVCAGRPQRSDGV